MYQPSNNISIDERMVRNKGRYAFRQYIKDKPTKWGMKFWVLADSLTGYTYDFDLYLGRGATISPNGLGYDVVLKLCGTLFYQGYRLFMDNFYSSVVLYIALLKRGIMACGTILLNRKNIPPVLKDLSTLDKARGSNRYVKDRNLLFVQWRDNKVVNFLSTMHQRTTNGTCKRRSKVNNKFQKLDVPQPQLVRDYNKYMSGVDRSDQMINKYNSLRKTDKYWKTIFYHLLDIARVNSFILFRSHTGNRRVNQLDFNLELIRQLSSITNETLHPMHHPQSLKTDHPAIVVPLDSKKNCKRCYERTKKQVKTTFSCSTCKLPFCLNKNRNCMASYHYNL